MNHFSQIKWYEWLICAGWCSACIIPVYDQLGHLLAIKKTYSFLPSNEGHVVMFQMILKALAFTLAAIGMFLYTLKYRAGWYMHLTGLLAVILFIPFATLSSMPAETRIANLLLWGVISLFLIYLMFSAESRAWARPRILWILVSMVVAVSLKLVYTYALNLSQLF
ncbi:MAG: hypothetical protein JST26_09325 [Bacteroidetes bacterium]|nr:hypothetical protein [Bacteroidota bacterium]